MKVSLERGAVLAALLVGQTALAGELHIMTTGLGSGTVTVSRTGMLDLPCTGDCTITATGTVTLRASAPGFIGWNADFYAPSLSVGSFSVGNSDCTGTSDCSLSIGASQVRRVKARFDRSVTAIAAEPDAVTPAT
ncbi:MAG: hypothetical protein JNK82_10900, partial [Myxococcaceae bacterium]|nr:hypothetical protein [Myxococcaceae bacterium]